MSNPYSPSTFHAVDKASWFLISLFTLYAIPSFKDPGLAKIHNYDTACPTFSSMLQGMYKKDRTHKGNIESLQYVPCLFSLMALAQMKYDNKISF